MQPRSPQYFLRRRTLSWNVGTVKSDMMLCRGFQHGERDELPFDVRFDLLREEAAQTGRGRLRPRARRELADRIVENLFGNGAGFGIQFPCVVEVERTPAFVTIETRAMAAEPGTLRPGFSAVWRRVRRPLVFEPGAAPETEVEVEKKARKADGPHAEICGSAPGSARFTGAQMFQHGGEQPEIFFAGFGGGEHLLRNFREKIENARRGDIFQHGELRFEDLTGIEVHEFAIFALEVSHFNMRKPFEAGTEAAFRTPRPPRHAPQLSEIPRQEADDQVAFPKGPGLQHERFAHTSGHVRNLKVITVTRTSGTATRRTLVLGIYGFFRRRATGEK